MVTHWRSMREATEAKRNEASFTAHRATSLLASLEDDMYESASVSTFESNRLQQSIQSKLDGMTTYSAIFDTMSFNDHQQSINEIRERGTQINFQQALQTFTISTTIEDISKKSSEKVAKAGNGVEELFQKQQRDLEEAEQVIENQQRIIDQMEKQQRSARAGGGGQAFITNTTQSDYLADRIGPVSCANLIFVAGMVKGPNLSQMWRRDAAVMFECYHRTTELLLATAHKCMGWIIHSSYFTGISVCFGNPQDALEFVNQAHEGLLKISWNIHLLKYPGYKMFQEKKASGEAVTVWRGMRVAFSMHTAPPRPPHSDSNAVTGRSDFASYDVWCAHNLLNIAEGGETLISSQMFDRLEKELSALKQVTVSKQVVLTVSDEEQGFGPIFDSSNGGGAPQGSSGPFAKDKSEKVTFLYQVHRVLPMSLSYRLKHLPPLRFSGSGDSGENSLMNDLSNFLEGRKKSNAGNLRKKVLQSGRDSLALIAAEAEGEVKREEGAAHGAAIFIQGVQKFPPPTEASPDALPPPTAELPMITLVSVVIPHLHRLMEKCSSSACQLVASFHTLLSSILKEEPSTGTILEVGRDQVLVGFVQLDNAVCFAREVHTRLIAGIVETPKELERFWFTQQDPSTLEPKVWGKGLAVSMGMHCGTDFEVVKRSTGYVQLGGDVAEYCVALGNTARVGETLVSSEVNAALSERQVQLHYISLVADPNTVSKLVALHSLIPRLLQKRERLLPRLQLHRAMELRDLANRQQHRKVLKNAPPPPVTPLWPKSHDDPAMKAGNIFKKKHKDKQRASDSSTQTDPLQEKEKEPIFDEALLEYTAGCFDVQGVAGSPTFLPLLRAKCTFKNERERHHMQFLIDSCIGEHCRKLDAKLSELKSNNRALKERVKQLREMETRAPNIIIQARAEKILAQVGVAPVTLQNGVISEKLLEAEEEEDASPPPAEVASPPTDTLEPTRPEPDTNIPEPNGLEDPVSQWKLVGIARELALRVATLPGAAAVDKTEVLRHLETLLRMATGVDASAVSAAAAFVAEFQRQEVLKVHEEIPDAPRPKGLRPGKVHRTKAKRRPQEAGSPGPGPFEASADESASSASPPPQPRRGYEKAYSGKRISLGEGRYLEADVAPIFNACRGGTPSPQRELSASPPHKTAKPRFGRPSIMSSSLPIVDAGRRGVVSSGPPPAQAVPEPNEATAVLDEFRRSPYQYLEIGKTYNYKGRPAVLKLMSEPRGTVGIHVEGTRKVMTVPVGDLQVSINSNVGVYSKDTEVQKPVSLPLVPHIQKRKVKEVFAENTETGGGRSDTLAWQTGLLNQMLQSYHQARVFRTEPEGKEVKKPATQHPPRKRSLSEDYSVVMMMSKAMRSQLDENGNEN